MITLHRLGQHGCFQLNPDLIVSVESTPDTVLTLATNAKVVVSDTPEQVTAAVRSWRTEVLADALCREVELQDLRARRRGARRALSAVEGERG